MKKQELNMWQMMIGLLLGLMVLVGCKQTEYVTVEKVSHDTTYITKHQRDSVWLHDSTFVYEKGDTMLIEKWHTKYKERILHDTTYISKTDTVPQPYPVIKEVEKQLNFFQKMTMTIGGFAILIGLIWVVIKFIVPHIKNPLP